MLQKYLTLWIFILVIFHKFTNKIFSLPFLTFTIMVMGLYISYINPRKYYFYYNGNDNDNENGNEIIIDGYIKNIIDIVFHISPFIYMVFIYGIEPFFINLKIIPSILLLILYNLIYCPERIYRLPKREIAIVSFISLIVYLFIIKINGK